MNTVEKINVILKEANISKVTNFLRDCFKRLIWGDFYNEGKGDESMYSSGQFAKKTGLTVRFYSGRGLFTKEEEEEWLIAQTDRLGLYGGADDE